MYEVKPGVVGDAATEQPLELAVVRLYDASRGTLLGAKVTSSTGQFVFLPRPGVYTVSVACHSHKPYHESHLVISKQRESVDMVVRLQLLPLQEMSVSMG